MTKLRAKPTPHLLLLKKLSVVGAYSVTFLLVSYLLYVGGWEKKKDTLIYSVPMFYLFFYWLRYKLDEEHFWDWRVLSLDTLVVLLSAVRIWGWMSHSGHVLFILYSFLTTPNKKYRWLCVPVVLITAYYKGVIWQDYFTPTVATAMALTAVFLRKAVTKSLN